MNSINALEPDETVASTNEIRCESGRKVRAFPSEIAERAQVIPGGGLVGDSDRVRVLESERRQPADVIELSESTRDVREYFAGICGDRIRKSVMKNGDQACTRVFGIDIDRIGAKGTERDLGGAESGTTIYGKTARLEKLREHLAQQVGFAERFGRNDDSLTSLRVGCL
jgi:hypothetical protein